MRHSTTRRECGRPLGHRYRARDEWSSPQLGLPLFERSGPIGLEQSRERSIGEHTAAGLACRAVVGFVVGVANALEGGSADWAGLLVAAMDRHPVFERAHLLWELRSRIRAQLLDPPSRGRSRGVVQSRDFRVAQFSRQLEW